MSIIRMTPKQFRRTKALIKNQCCNYFDGECLLLDCPCPQMITYSLVCKWFKTAVLPNDTELHIQMIKPKNTKRCIVCGKEYVSTGRNSKYCNICRQKVIRRKDAERKRKKRSKSAF